MPEGPDVAAPADFDWYATYVPEPAARENTFREAPRDFTPPPAFDATRAALPAPFWHGHDDEIAAYWTAWRLAFAHLRAPTPDSGFPGAFLDSAFNGHLFLWDSAFAVLFARFGRRAFDFARTLDVFYAKQHPDGFICREIREDDGTDCFARFDPASTGPEVLAFAEWLLYRDTGGRDRLARVFAPLLGYRRWLRSHRTWPDGTSWTSGWGSGMDNAPRLPGEIGDEPAAWWGHGHLSWVDASFQALLSTRLLARMARELGRGEADALNAEADRQHDLCHRAFWNPAEGFYTDRFADGTSSAVKTVGGFWALHGGPLPPGRLALLSAHLRNPATFGRLHPVPTLSADSPHFAPRGGYWRGGVWPPTTHMVLTGLAAQGRGDLAHDLARRALELVARVHRDTGTLWENYAPDAPAPGTPSTPDFVGWSGLMPVAGLLEFVFGLSPRPRERRLVWHVRLLDAHGVEGYPFGLDEALDLRCEARGDASERPRVTVRAVHVREPVTVEVRWAGGAMDVRA